MDLEIAGNTLLKHAAELRAAHLHVIANDLEAVGNTLKSMASLKDDGTVYEEKTCNRCEGAGERFHEGMEAMATCNKCNGKGKIKVRADGAAGPGLHQTIIAQLVHAAMKNHGMDSGMLWDAALAMRQFRDALEPFAAAGAIGQHPRLVYTGIQQVAFQKPGGEFLVLTPEQFSRAATVYKQWAGK